MMQQYSKGMVALMLLSGAQAALRLFFAASLTGVLGTDLQQQVMGMVEVPVADWTMMMALPFLLLGALGAVSTVGLVLGRRWGVPGILTTSLLTIVYDLWAAQTMQSSALIGIVLPAVLVFYLIGSRSRRPSPSGVRP